MITSLRILLAATFLAAVLAAQGVVAQQPKGPPGVPKQAPLRNGFNLPPPGETRFVPNEVMLDVPASVPPVTLDQIAARHTMTRLETRPFLLT